MSKILETLLKAWPKGFSKYWDIIHQDKDTQEDKLIKENSAGISNTTKINTLPVEIFTIWTDPSLEPVRARVEVELIAKHVNPSV